LSSKYLTPLLIHFEPAMLVLIDNKVQIEFSAMRYASFRGVFPLGEHTHVRRVWVEFVLHNKQIHNKNSKTILNSFMLLLKIKKNGIECFEIHVSIYARPLNIS
ncbi:hypothetical protein L9F63_002697, partial [Diploptera punctata]